MNFKVEYGRCNWIANVKKYSVTPTDEDEYFETNWELSLYKDGTLFCYTMFSTQYDGQPMVTDVVEAISRYFNAFCIYFAKYGEKEKTKKKEIKIVEN